MVLKEFQKTNLQSFSDGQITINFPNEEELTNVDVVLTPTDGLYKGGRFAFRVCLPRDYPESVAAITCRTLIFHPNINYEGNICFNILSGTHTRTHCTRTARHARSSVMCVHASR
jgi:ubiquitin-protein ligase